MTIAELDIEDEGFRAPSPVDEMVSEAGNIDEAIEAILFAAGHPMTYEQLAKPFEMSPSLMRQRVFTYAERYNASEYARGVILLAFEDSCQLCTKQEYLHHIRVALGIRKSGSLSTSCIEALAIIAYNQPTTRAYVDNVRNVDSSYAISTLLERGLIEARGRLEAPGRPMLYGTTPGFLRSFGLSSLEELPGISSEEAYETLRQLERAMNPAEVEGQVSIDDQLKETDEAEKAKAPAADAEAAASESTAVTEEPALSEEPSEDTSDQSN